MPSKGEVMVTAAIGVGVWAILADYGKPARHAVRETAAPRPAPTRTVIVQHVAAAHPLLTGTDIVWIVIAVLAAVTAWAAITRPGGSDG